MPLDAVIKIKMPDSPVFPDGQGPTGDDLVWVADVSTGNTLRKAKISDLPFTNGGGGGGSGSETVTSPSPFMVFNGDANITYDAGTGNTIIRDTRLKNKALYPVFATQLGGGELNPAMISYMDIDTDDDSKGRLTISGFQLDDGAHLTLIVPGDTSSGDTAFTQLKADVALLKAIAAPFIKTALGANAGKVWWVGDTMPTGWQECVAMRGKIPMHIDPDDDDLDGNPGDDGGAKDVKLIATNIPELSTTVTVPLKTIDGDRGSNSSLFSLDDRETVTVTVGTPDAQMTKVKIIPPIMKGIWIEFIGL